MRGASSKETVAWVCDQLHAVMGCSDRTTARFIVALAEKARDVGDLESGLGDAAIELTPATRRFAASLYARSRGGGARAARAAPRARAVAAESEAALRDRALAYDLVVGVEDDADAAALRKLQRKQKKKKEKEERKRAAKARAAGDGAGDGAAPRKRQRGRNRRETVAAAILDDDDDDAPTELVRRTPGTAAAAAAAAEPTAEELAAQARDADQLAKEEFEARLRARDEEKTRTLAGISAAADSKALDASAEAMTPAEREALVAKLRKESRYAYLTKREEKELKLLEWQIKDEEYLYEGQMHKLSSEERRQHEMNKVLLEAARARQKDGAELDSFARYQMPTAYDDGAAGTGEKNDKFTALTRRFEADEGPQLTEQERWEEQQTATATFRAGAKDKLAALDSAGASRGYEYVFEDQIDFISSELNAGKVVQKVRADGVVVEEEGEVVVAGDKPQSEKTIAEVRVSLPIYDYRQQLLDAIADNQVLIVVGETGSGKTTQIPQYLHEAGYTTPASENGEQSAVRVGCTQPRRVAAMSVASRVAQEMEVKLGAEVGYAIRFEDCTSEKTVVKYMTDGMLLRELLNEPDLASYSALMIDEAHERTLHTDILFGLIKDISRFRTDIKLVISSATMDAKRFAEYFDDAPIFNIPGRMYHVELLYTKAPEADYIDAAIVTVLQAHISQPLPGDILVFLTGQQEIETAEQILRMRTQGLGTKIAELIICPCYSTLPAEKQALIFVPTPKGARKVVLATNIAETSLTIDGVTFVIDPGFAKQKSYNPRTGMESLIVTPCSQAAANQRSGRAGRTAPGKCFRLFTQWSFQHELPENTIPEIQRTNMGSVVLMLKSMGINDLIHFDFMDPPPAETLIRALELLYALGALNSEGELTKLGRRMAEFPCDPQLAKMILASEEYQCSEEIVTIAAMLDVNNSIFYRPADKKVHADQARMNFARGGKGDHLALLNVYNEWVDTNYSRQWCIENYIQEKSMKRGRDIRDQLADLCDRVEIEMVSMEATASTTTLGTDRIRKAITSGFFYQTAKLQKSGSYRTIKNAHTVAIHPTSCMHNQEQPPRWILYHELVFTTKEFMRQIMPIHPKWLHEIAPHYYAPQEVTDESAMKLPKGVGRARRDADS